MLNAQWLGPEPDFRLEFQEERKGQFSGPLAGQSIAPPPSTSERAVTYRLSRDRAALCPV
jgi:hypothetical protein